ncbi:hypothetical protein M2128_000083 [Polynucleobacter sphagniphilus]|jgi:hypothetical protein|nr:hypothetical protein [Polynucleobacter sphagniphilus]MDH6524411.1 hypothetical protein [Polynucleobacter sphagniphilus]
MSAALAQLVEQFIRNNFVRQKNNKNTYIEHRLKHIFVAYRKVCYILYVT